jgi:hypothetical protein
LPPLSTSESVVNPVQSAGGYWDPDSIERRVGRRRREAPVDAATGAPMGRSGICRGQPSEEDVYLAAGAPGYGEHAVERKAWVCPPPTLAPLAPPGDGHAAASQEGVGVGRSSAAGGGGGGGGTTHPGVPTTPLLGGIIRLSTGVVPKKTMPYFLQQWKILALPAYQALPGCVSARLLVGEKSKEMEEEGLAGKPEVGTRGGDNTVVVVTEWRDLEALSGASQVLEYTQAMRQISGHFKGAPVVQTLGQEKVYAFVAKSEEEVGSMPGGGTVLM